MAARTRVIVIGGGVAGIAAATALADAGLAVELFEKRSMLGGRASSFIDPETGEVLDACQHGTMRCCTNLQALLERLDVAHLIRYCDTLEFQDSSGMRSRIYASPLPAPGHTALSFLRFGALGVRDKLAIARGLLAILRCQNADADRQDIGSWLRETGQTERAVRRFWRPILVSACNAEPEDISRQSGFKIFRDGFLAHPRAYQFGIPRVPLGTLYTEPAVAYLQRRGGCVRLREHVDAVEYDAASNRIAGLRLVDGMHVCADLYVSALQFDLLLKLLPERATAGNPYFEQLRGLRFSPIVGVHLWFDRPIDCPQALALLDRESDWIFNKNANFDRPEGERAYLSVVISANRTLADLPKEQVLERVLADVHACLPATSDAHLKRWRVLKERKATFVPAPGVEALRPDQRSPVLNLYVAGEWTRTGWPSTMESAARSGYLAAERVLEDLGAPVNVTAPELPAAALARILAGKIGKPVIK